MTCTAKMMILVANAARNLVRLMPSLSLAWSCCVLPLSMAEACEGRPQLSCSVPRAQECVVWPLCRSGKGS